jgi:hypothetical protein
MPKFKNSLFFPGFTIILAVPIVLHAYLGSFSRLLGDDYCSAYQANRFGILRAVWYWYLNWSGRYSASALDSLFGILGPGIMPLATPAAICLWLLAIGFALYKWLPEREGKLWKVSALAAGAVFLTLNFSPYIQQSLYWGQGMRAIIPPLILGTAYIGVFILAREKQPQNRLARVLWYLFSFFSMLIVGGFSETTGVLQFAALTIGLLILILSRRQIYGFEVLFLSSGLLGTMLAVAIVVLAPGNAFRAAYFPPPPNMAGIISISFRSLLAYLAGLFSSKEAILGFTGILGTSFMTGLNYPEKAMKPSEMLLVILAGVLLVAVCFPPAAYGMSDAPPGRTLLIPTYVLALLTSAAGFLLGSYGAKNKIFENTFVTISIQSIVVILLLVSSAFTSRGLLSSRQAYIEFARSWDKTHQTLLRINKEVEPVIVPAVIDDWSGVLRMADNPRFYVNQCVSDYYGFKTVIATDDLPPTEP